MLPGVRAGSRESSSLDGSGISLGVALALLIFGVASPTGLVV